MINFIICVIMLQKDGATMILFYEPKPKDRKIVERDVSKAFGIDNPVKIESEYQTV